jgi:HAMP domain-containing protein
MTGDALAASATASVRAHPRRRRAVRWLVAVMVVIVAGAWAAASALQLDRAYREDQRGLATIEAARAGLSTTSLTSGQVLTSLQAAERSFSAASRRLDNPLFDPTLYLPVVGRQLGSARALSAAANQAASVASTAASQLRPLVSEVHATGEARVQLLREAAGVASHAERSLARISLGPSTGLVSQLAQRRSELATQLHTLTGTLRQSSAAMAALATLLQGPGRYLILAANNNEMRAGSGMFLDAGVLTTNTGQLQLSPIQPTSSLTLPPGVVPLSGSFAARWAWMDPSGEWRNLAVSPRFEVTGALAARMWQAKTGQKVDGVIVLDDDALAELLHATSPVSIGGQTLDSANVVPFLLHDQYVDAGSNDARQDELGALAQAVFTDAVDGNPAEAGDHAATSSLTSLATGLAQSALGRHILAWSSDPREEALWRQAGAAGTVGAKSLLTSVLNIGGNKLDQYLSVRDDLSFSVHGGRTSVTLKVHLANKTPPGEPHYITGPTTGSNLAPGEYAGLISVSLPGNAKGAWIEGRRSLPVAGQDGPTQVVAAPIELLAGGQTDVVVHFTLPGRHGEIDVQPSARIPPITYQVGHSGFTDAQPHVVRW